MNRKKISLIVLVVVIISIAVLAFIFLNKKKTPIVPVNNNQVATLPTSTLVTVSTPQTSSSTVSSNNQVIDSCSGLISIERDDCLTKKATASKNTKLCADIQNASARAYCLGSSSAKSATQNATILSPYVTVGSGNNQSSSSNTASKSAIDSVFAGNASMADVAAQINSFMGETTSDPLTEFFDRASNLKPILFIVNPTEVKPGSIAKATGSGFKKSGNTVFIGNESVTGLESPDGMNISFTVPNIPEGRYETWVTNNGGSSKRSEFPLYVTISNNATPPPTGLAVSPEAPKLSDTITVSGNNLSNVAGVYTSLGTASGLSFKLQDLQFYSLLQKSLADNPIIKAIPIVIMVMTKSGLSDPLMVNVTTP